MSIPLSFQKEILQSVKYQILKEYYSQPHYRGLQVDLSRKYKVGQTTLSFWIRNSRENQRTMLLEIKALEVITAEKRMITVVVGFLAIGLLNLIFFVLLSIFLK